MTRTEGRSSGARFRAASLAWSVSLGVLFAAADASADGTTGLWPDLSAPVMTPREPSKDAALVVGIERYDALPKVVGAADTARDWERYFLLARRVPPDRVRLLTDQNATAEVILARARELSARVEAGGTLFVVFIGHGAPADGGQKGLLLGADARASETSFATRSLSYDQLREATSAGTQERTVMVLDACFSGIANTGKTLLPEIQPVVAAKLLSAAKTTVFSAGEAGEYAGALPGSQRPALSYLLLGAMRGWADSDHDGKTTAAEAHAYASLVMRSLPNSHEQHPQLSTDAPDELLEAGPQEKAPDLPTLRTKLDTWRPPSDSAAGGNIDFRFACADSELLTPGQGFKVVMDGAREPTLQTLTAARADGSPQATAVRVHVPAGTHYLRFGSAACLPLKTQLQISDGETLSLAGRLAADRSLAEKAPFEKRNHWAIGLEGYAHVYSSTEGGLAPIYSLTTSDGSGYSRRKTASPAGFNGLALTVQMPARMFELEWSAMAGIGSWRVVQYEQSSLTPSRPVGDSDLDAYELQSRLGGSLRIPLGLVAFRPIGLAAGAVAFTGKDHNGSATTNVGPIFVARTGADLALGCHFVLRGSGEVASLLSGYVMFGASLGIALAPSGACSRDGLSELKISSDREL